MIETVPRHGGQLAAIARRFGVDAASLVDFSASINPDGPPPAVVQALRAALDRPETLTLYPDLEELRLKDALAGYAGVSAQNLLVANGFVPLLDAALQALPIESCCMPVPCFVEYRSALERAGVEVRPLGLCERESFRYDPLELLAQDADAILLANPQNPTGALLGREAMEFLIAEAGRRGKYVLLDEAFIDYVPADSMTPYVDAHPNLIVFRSVTKCFGMPGLRVAYAATAQEICRTIERKIHPWSVSTLASVGTIAALEDAAYPASFRVLNQSRRERLRTGLVDSGVPVFTGAANSLLLQLAEGKDANECWEKLIVKHGLLLRNCANFEGLRTGFLRAAVRNDEDNDRLIAALG